MFICYVSKSFMVNQLVVRAGVCVLVRAFIVLFLFLSLKSISCLILSDHKLLWFGNTISYRIFSIFLYMGIMKVLNLITGLLKKENIGPVYRPCTLFSILLVGVNKIVICLYMQNFLNQNVIGYPLSLPCLKKGLNR